MDYIVDPSLIYLMHVLDGLTNVCIAIAVLSGFGLLALTIYCTISESLDDESFAYFFKKVKKAYIIFAIAFPLAALFAILIPDKTTMIGMMIAKYATKQNIAWSVEQIKSIVDYIVNAIQQI